MKDLWETDFMRTASPASVLNEQAQFLTSTTNGEVRGCVAFENSAQFEYFAVKFMLEAHRYVYTFHLFTITYDYAMYPINFRGNDEILGMLIQNNIGSECTLISPCVKVKNMYEYLAALKLIFNSEYVTQIINIIINSDKIYEKQKEE